MAALVTPGSAQHLMGFELICHLKVDHPQGYSERLLRPPLQPPVPHLLLARVAGPRSPRSRKADGTPQANRSARLRATGSGWVPVASAPVWGLEMTVDVGA